jgi:hypothetical protein
MSHLNHRKPVHPDLLDAWVKRAQKAEAQLKRANRLIGWMMPYIGRMCPPSNGLFDLNEHCMENIIPEPGKETKSAPIDQLPAGVHLRR